MKDQRQTSVGLPVSSKCYSREPQVGLYPVALPIMDENESYVRSPSAGEGRGPQLVLSRWDPQYIQPAVSEQYANNHKDLRNPSSETNTRNIKLIIYLFLVPD